MPILGAPGARGPRFIEPPEPVNLRHRTGVNTAKFTNVIIISYTERQRDDIWSEKVRGLYGRFRAESVVLSEQL